MLKGTPMHLTELELQIKSNRIDSGQFIVLNDLNSRIISHLVDFWYSIGGMNGWHGHIAVTHKYFSVIAAFQQQNEVEKKHPE